MKRLFFCTLAAASLLLAGCNTSFIRSTPPVPGQLSSSGRPVVGNIEASNTGLYLFYWLPVWSGSTTRPNRREYNMFSDRLHNRYMYPMLEDRSRLLKGDGVEDVISRESSSGWMTLWILWRRTRFLSAVAVDKHAPKPAAESEKVKKTDANPASADSAI